MAKIILVVEDNPVLRNDLKILLEMENYSVILASDGAEGIMKYIECMPDLILCDVSMPNLNGYEMLEKLREENELFLTPFIYITGKTAHKDHRKGMELGADDYLHKPVDPGDLLRAINVQLNKYSRIKLKLDSAKIYSGVYSPGDKVFFHVHDHSVPVNVEKITHILAERQYTRIFADDGKHYIIKRALNKWEEKLPKNLFIRIHRSTIINRNYISKILKLINNSYVVQMTNCKESFEVSRRFYKNIKNIVL